MTISGNTKGYENRGGGATASLSRQDAVYDLCECGNKKYPSMYVCNKCLDNFSYMLTIPALLSDKPEVVKNGRSCRKCSHIDECRVLVVKNLPVKCEIWDEFDLLALAPAKFP